MNDLPHAMSLHRAGKLAEAQAIYQQLLAADPGNAQLLNLLGLIACQTARLDDAADLLARAVARDPDSAEYLINLGEIQRRRGKLSEALAAFERAAVLAPDSPVAHYNLAVAQSASGQNEPALASYQRALELQPHYPEAHNNLGLLLTAMGRHEEALASLEKARTARPNNPDMENNIGLVLWNLHRHAEALAAFDRVIALRPNFAPVHANRGWVLRRLGQPVEAIAAFQIAARLHPNSADIHRDLAMALLAIRRIDFAVSAARRAVELAPAQADTHHALGVTLAAAAKENPDLRPQAIAAFQRALQLKPTDEWQFELDMLEDRTPATAPDNYVRSLFDDYAPTFDNHLVQQLGYRVPNEILAAVRKAWLDLPLRALDLDILDLGQGTGLCGQLLRPHARSIVGIDLSPKMIAAAARRRDHTDKPVYDRLIESHLTPALREFESAFDLAVAGDVLIYIGALEETFTAVTRALKPGGLFAFSLERCDGPEPFILRERYRHDIAYVRRLAAENHLAEISVRSCQLRADVPVGWLVVLRKMP